MSGKKRKTPKKLEDWTREEITEAVLQDVVELAHGTLGSLSRLNSLGKEIGRRMNATRGSEGSEGLPSGESWKDDDLSDFT